MPLNDVCSSGHLYFFPCCGVVKNVLPFITIYLSVFLILPPPQPNPLTAILPCHSPWVHPLLPPAFIHQSLSIYPQPSIHLPFRHSTTTTQPRSSPSSPVTHHAPVLFHLLVIHLMVHRDGLSVFDPNLGGLKGTTTKGNEKQAPGPPAHSHCLSYANPR